MSNNNSSTAKIPPGFPFESLSFVGEGSNWFHPAPIDYRQACIVGRRQAYEYIEYLKMNPEMIGGNVLGAIIKDMDFIDKSERVGFTIGFLSAIEELLYQHAVK